MSYNSDGAQSSFYAQSGSSYWPTDNVAVSNGFPADTIPFFTSSGSSLARCFVPIPLPWPFKTAFIDSVAQGLVYFTDDTLGSIWLTQQGLYKYLVLNDTITSDTIIHNFKAEADTGNFGRFERINDALLSGKFEDAEDANDSITDTETPTVALKTVNSILIDAFIDEIEFEDMDSVDIDTLISIAEQCPYYYGNAVYISRLILSLIDTMEYVNECELPDNGQSQRIAFHSETDNNEINNFSVYPNPANDLINVLNPNGSTALIEIYNYLGKKIITQKLSNINNIISLKGLSNGLYIYMITDNNKTVKSDKLIIQK